MSPIANIVMPRETTPVTASRLSVSQINTYSQCPLKWFLSRRFRAEFVPAALVFGSAFHNGLESYWQAMLEGRQVDADDMLAVFDKAWQKEQGEIRFGKTETAESLRATASQMFEAYLSQVQPCDVIALEERFLCRIADDLPPFLGFIDFIGITKDEDGNDCIILVDFKTAARKSNACGLGSDQLVMYRIAAERIGLLQEFGLPIRLRYEVITKTKSPEVTSVEVTPTEHDTKRVVAKARACHRGMVNDVIYPCPGWQCSGCGYRKMCEKWPDACEDTAIEAPAARSTTEVAA